LWHQAKDARLRSDANKVLEANGLAAYTYVASFGVEDMQLRAAMDRLAFTAQIYVQQQVESID
jgi:hypothetical protein